MDDMSAYYPPPVGLPNTQYPYYQPPPPPLPLGAPQPPPTAVPHLQPHLPQQYEPYPYATYVHLPYQQSSQNDVRTLFIAGLPEDVKPREIYNLFREFPGYESSHLRCATSNSQPFAFAVFVDQQSAVAALHALNGMIFDLEKGSTLYIDLAKSNSRTKRLRIDDERSGSEKRQKGSSFSRGTSDSGGGSIHMPGAVNSAYNTIGYPSTQSYGNSGNKAISDVTSSVSNAPPCPTLFVANLGPSCSEEELIQIFSRCRGYLKLKLQCTYGTPVSFVDFQDTACSTEALTSLQGTLLHSSPSSEGMRLEYAKSRMGMRSKKSR